MVCYVRIVHIGPESYRFGKILPHALVFPDTFLTLVYKRSQSVFLDLFLSVKTQKLFDLKLDRKTVGIPAGLTRNIIALHGTVSRDHVLDNTCKNVSYVGLTVGCRRSVIEHVGLGTFTYLKALLEYIVLGPELLYFLFSFDKSQIR